MNTYDQGWKDYEQGLQPRSLAQEYLRGYYDARTFWLLAE